MSPIEQRVQEMIMQEKPWPEARNWNWSYRVTWAHGIGLGVTLGLDIVAYVIQLPVDTQRLLAGAAIAEFAASAAAVGNMENRWQQLMQSIIDRMGRNQG